ncbi:hypothetical protein X797_012433, partial [Metarhizium robertsii]
MHTTDVPSRLVSRMNMPGIPTNASDSELSDPLTNTTFSEVEDEIVVGGQNKGAAPKMSNRSPTLDNTVGKVVEEAPEESSGSHYTKRKHNFAFDDLSESRLESSHETATQSSPAPPAGTIKFKPSHQSSSGPGVKGVLLGTWRHSSVPDDQKKHAVIGFIDVRGRLRTRIQPRTKHGDSLAEEYPLPPGPGGTWVTFDRIIFSDHLVGLDYFKVKEYTRLRSEVAPEETEEDRVAAEHAAVQEAIRRVGGEYVSENPVDRPAIAQGLHMPKHLEASVYSDNKRRRFSGPFAASNPAPPEVVPETAADITMQKYISAFQTHHSIDPLLGTRPTRILLGYWKPSSEVDPKDRHAVYGILCQDDVFGVRVVRETRDGRFVDGNFPSGAGSQWVFYEEVAFEPHLQALSKEEIKEYCRVRQHQFDHGETSAKRVENETKAVYEARIRAGTMPYRKSRKAIVPMFAASPLGDGDKHLNGQSSYGGPELRQLRRTELRSIQVSP